MKKIVYVIDILEVGGAQQYIFDIINALKSEFDFHILAFEGGPFVQRFKKIGVKVDILGISSFKIGIRYPQNTIAALKWLEKKYSEIKPDIIQTHLLGADIWGRMAARKTKAEVIQTIHSAETFRGTSSKFGLKTMFFDRMLAKNTNKIIAVSRAAKDSIAKQGIDPNKILVIYTGINTKQFAPSKDKRKKYRQDLQISDDEIAIGSVGRLETVKAFDVLIKAISLLKNQNIKLFIAGDGTQKKNLQALINKLGLKKQITLLGTRNDVKDLLNAYDIYTISSHYEGMPLSLIEAAANQKAIIATKVGGIAEFISDNKNGLLIEPGNPKNLASKIEQLIKNKDLGEKLALQAFKDSQKFDIITYIANQYKKIYNA